MSDGFDDDAPSLERGEILGGPPPWVRLAMGAMSSGNWASAIHHLRRALGADPDLATAHALLSLCLTHTNRLYAAEHEARRALQLEPELPEGHFALGLALRGRGKLEDARKALEQVLALEPEHVGAMLGLAQLRRQHGDGPGERRMLERALQVAPGDESVHVALGSWHLVAGELAEAQRHADDARALAPEDTEVLVLQGELALRRGRVQEARDHAIWALRHDATDPGALALLASIQARQSLLLGLWWRYSVWMQARGDKGQIVVLMAAWLVVQLATQVLTDLGYVGAADTLSTVWLAVAVYSWVGPGLFQAALDKELRRVRLRDDF